jgi:hypothetical protein
MNHNARAPTPTLPRKREREHASLLSSLPAQAEAGAHLAPFFPLPLAGEGGALVRARRVGAGSIEISHPIALQHSGSARVALRPE